MIIRILVINVVKLTDNIKNKNKIIIELIVNPFTYYPNQKM